MALFDRLKQIIRPEDGNTSKMVTMNTDIQNDYETTHEKNHHVTDKEKNKQTSMLTPREYDLFLLLLEGFTLKECATRLSIKYSTANTHMTGIYKKLGVKSRAELIIHYRNVS